ncbi:hypothetical protein JOS77_00405 [Chromobacterium haemolyticum]|nr:hypothetical protein JOS77_00405 [Chromobacterium haemolyticum]
MKVLRGAAYWQKGNAPLRFSQRGLMLAHGMKPFAGGLFVRLGHGVFRFGGRHGREDHM